ncbi:MAG: family 78 glycoside hydrolase catalytic domain [Verrucomicrobia bacterium]|nr:family 78 glycoside hydrolase catalytic domain [Verrucomicrobiota bacterium]
MYSSKLPHLLLWISLACALTPMALARKSPKEIPATVGLVGESSAPYALRCEYLPEPLGVESEAPRFSWKLQTPEGVRGHKQTAYRILVASDRAILERNEGDLWDSGEIESGQSVLVPYGGKKLLSNTECHWKVKIHDERKAASSWSKPARFAMGLLSEEDWKGPWIKHPEALPVQHIWFRKSFPLKQEVKSAFVHVASLGYHELYLNGTKVDDRVLAPAASRLDKRVLYVTYDIGHLLKPGTNTIAVWQGPGWSRLFRSPPALRMQLQGLTKDGNPISLSSDSTWRCQISSSETIGGITYKDMGGERIDARQFLTEWAEVKFDDSSWLMAKEVPLKVTMSAQMIEPTRVIKTLPVKEITKSENGYRVDLGENFTGWVEIKLHDLAAGDLIIVQASDDDKTLQDWTQRSEYIARGDKLETFRNRFNYQAGRYLNLQGLKKAPAPADIQGYALSTDVSKTGGFSSSSELFNRIHAVDLWTWRANFVEGYTMDCPHRERLGYGEVALACGWGIAFPFYETGAYHAKLVRDWMDVQRDDGFFPFIAPHTFGTAGGPLWSSGGLNLAWEFHLNTGDTRVLEAMYEPAKKWLEFLHFHTADGLLQPTDKKPQKFLGDWAAPGGRKEQGDTPEAKFFNNCVYAFNLEEVIGMAKALGKPEDASFYNTRLQELRKNIHATYFDATKNSYSKGTQVQLAFALLTGVVPEALRPAVIQSLKKEFTAKPYFDMGSSGLPMLLKFVTENAETGRQVYPLASSTEMPSYGHFLKMGESTWPEYWSVNVASKIHTCYTGISGWFIKSVAGIRPDPEKPGYKSIIIKPIIGGDLTFAEGTSESLYGTITSRWERKGNSLDLKVTIPANSQATVHVPGSDVVKITESGKPAAKAKGVRFVGMEAGYAIFEVSSGSYHFQSK